MAMARSDLLVSFVRAGATGERETLKITAKAMAARGSRFGREGERRPKSNPSRKCHRLLARELDLSKNTANRWGLLP
jgi:hypothetical protein